MAIESTCQSSVEVLLRRFGRCGEFLPPPPFSVRQRDRTRFDGGSEVDVLREDQAKGAELTSEQLKFLCTRDAEAWRRPMRPVREDPSGVGSTYARNINTFAVSRCSSYRVLKCIKGECLAESVVDDMDESRSLEEGRNVSELVGNPRVAKACPAQCADVQQESLVGECTREGVANDISASGNAEARENVSDAVRKSHVARVCPAQGEEKDVAAEAMEDCEVFLFVFFHTKGSMFFAFRCTSKHL